MESLTKPVISPETLAAIAHKHLGAGPATTAELKDGWFNAAFLLSQPDGNDYVLKIAPPPSVPVLRYEKNLMTAEVNATRLVAERTNLPMPKIIAYDTSCQEVESEYFIMKRLPGVPYNHLRDELTAEVRQDLDQKVAKCLADLNSIEGPGYGLFNDTGHKTWSDAFRSLMADLQQDGIDAKVDLPPGAFELATPHLWSLNHVTRPAFVHWDLWDGNIFIDRESAQITGLIDFERALWGDPLMEVNFFEIRPGFLEGYGRDPFDEPGAKERRFLYDLYFFLVMIIESTYRGFTKEHESWPREKLAGLLERKGP